MAITPNLDKFIEEGTNFTNYYVNAPVCAPSRMSFLTGKYPSQLKVCDNGIEFPENEMCIADILKRYGYDTAQIGKLHFLPHVNRKHTDKDGSTYGFNTFLISDEPGCYDDDYVKWVEMIDPRQVEKVRVGLPSEGRVYNQPEYTDRKRSPQNPYVFDGDDDLTHSSFVTDQACRYIERKKKTEEPFLLIAGYYAPHAPINPPQKFMNLYNAEDMPMPITSEKDRKIMAEFFPQKYTSELSELSDQNWREIVKGYYALVTHVDDCVGNLLSALDDIKDNTIVVFTSDHGEYLGDHQRVHKGMPGHDCIINVPFIIRYPDQIGKGVSYHGLCEAVDFMPTILDYCGIQIPSDLKGKSLRKPIQDPNLIHKESILVESVQLNGVIETTIRTLDYKYYVSSGGIELLYDLKKDEHELMDVSNHPDYLGVKLELRLKMIHKIQSAAYHNLKRTAPY